ncbi:MAG: PAS domain-containing sensor histidine kinase [Gemmatimonadaceae bacterium]
MNRRWGSGVALVTGGSAILLLALWLRNPLLPYGSEPRAASGDQLEARAHALSQLRSALSNEVERLTAKATSSLDAPAATPFDHLESVGTTPEEGIILFDHNTPIAWTGQLVVPPDTGSSLTSVSFSPFYTTVSVVAQRNDRRAVATGVVHAEPPADRLVKSLDARVARRDKIASYTFGIPGDTSAGESVLQVRGATLLRADATPLPRGVMLFARSAKVRAWGTMFLCAGALLLLGFAWRDRKLLGERLFAIAILLAAAALVPWSNFSNTARAFDPTYYFSPAGGPFTANAGVLAVTCALLLLAVYAIVRSRGVRPPRGLSLVGSIVFAVAGPLIVESIAPGIAFPSWGTTAALWLTWEIPLFLLLFAFWLTAVWLGRIAFRQRGTLHLGFAAAVAIAAGVCASAIVWRVATEKRLELAAHDILRLENPDPDGAALLRRFGTELRQYDSAGTRADLLKRYASSDLAAADLPLALATWSVTGERTAELRLAPFPYDSSLVAKIVDSARDTLQPVIVQTLGVNGREVIMAMRHSASGVTTAVASPRTQLVPPDPFVSLLGFSPPVQTDPPYVISIADVSSDVIPRGRVIHWRRSGTSFHGDRVIATSLGPKRVHAEVDLRSIAARVERLVLIVILNAALAGMLWALGALVEGGFVRWVRARSVKWIRSYRGRLTLALSAFFAIPALAFAIWSYQRLRTDDRDVRELLVHETLDAVVAAADSAKIGEVVRPYNTPLFLYSSGVLSAASDSLLDELASPGRALPPPVYLSIVGHGELNASWQRNVGQSRVLFGYRAASAPQNQRYVLAAPARSDELTLDRRRRDLTILVLFATVLGAVAALWLSGVAAKRLARDLELSRIEVARAERILAWGEMARQVAHEIKNPLTPIRLGVQHLKRARTDPRVNFERVLDENVTRILSEIDRLDEIARAFSRYGSAPSELPPAEDIDVAGIIRDVVGLEKMGVGELTWTLSGAENPIFAKARSDELREVLLNIFENSRLARARKVEVRVSRGQNSVLIAISDDGSGIDQTALPRVFEPQFSTRTTGSGLGLAISRRLLESWGGAIEITSEPGKGTRVTLTLLSAS